MIGSEACLLAWLGLHTFERLTMHILVIEDDPYWQQTITGIFSQYADYQIAAMCGDLRNALSFIRTQSFDLLIVDLGLSDGSGIEAIREARQRHADVDILVATVFADERNVVAAIFAGATGYILKETDPEQWHDAIEDLRAGHSPIDPRVARHILGTIQSLHHATADNILVNPPLPAPKVARAQDPKLSQRELEVLQLVAKGFTLVEVARILGVSAHTARSHAKAIYRKLEVSSQGEAVFEAGQIGLI